MKDLYDYKIIFKKENDYGDSQFYFKCRKCNSQDCINQRFHNKIIECYNCKTKILILFDSML